MAKVVEPDLLDKWSVQDAVELYGIRHWGKGYFAINKDGHVVVHPDKHPEHAIDLKQLVDELQARGIQLPILLRFTDILRHRVGEIHDAFKAAMQEYDYQGGYCCVYPIKVNQQRHVVEEILDFGKPFHFGLEAGSKPELLAVLAMTNGGNDTPIICNGFKDDEFIKMAVLARKIGKNVIPVVEKFTELEAIVRYAEELKRPAGRSACASSWPPAAPAAGSTRAGFRSKFGLSLTEVLEALDFLKQRGMADCLQLVHFHLGSQITNIRNIKNAVNEAARVYVELARVGAGVKYLDVGGGLGIDYDGCQTDFESSVNYTLQEYANDVVFRIKSVCDEAGVPHPTIISESGRAVVAYHSVLVFDVLGVSTFDRYEAPGQVPDDAPQPIQDLFAIYRDLSKKNLLESYHDAVQAVDETLNLFSLGYLTRRAAGDGRVALLGGLPQGAADHGRAGVRPRRAARPARRCCRTPTSATSRSSSRCRTAGRSTSSSRSCRSTASTSSRPGGRCWATSPATRTARSTSSSTCATCAARWSCTPTTAGPTTWGRSCWGPTRRSSATCTTCSATPTPCTSAWTTTAASASITSSRATRCARCWPTCSIPPTSWWRRCARTWNARCGPGRFRWTSRGSLLRFYESGLEGYTYLEEP